MVECTVISISVAIMRLINVIEAELLTTNEANDECLEGLGVMVFVFGLSVLTHCVLVAWLFIMLVLDLVGVFLNLFHAIPVDQEDPLVHLEIFNVQR